MHIYNLIIKDLKNFKNTPNQRKKVQNVFFHYVHNPRRIIFFTPQFNSQAGDEIIKVEAEKLAELIDCKHFPLLWLDKLTTYDTNKIYLMLLEHKKVKSFQADILLYGTNGRIDTENGSALINKQRILAYPSYGWELQFFNM